MHSVTSQSELHLENYFSVVQDISLPLKSSPSNLILMQLNPDHTPAHLLSKKMFYYYPCFYALDFHMVILSLIYFNSYFIQWHNQQWLNIRNYTAICLKRFMKTMKNLSGQPVPTPKFEPGTFRTGKWSAANSITRFPSKTVFTFVTPPIRASCPVHLILLDINLPTNLWREATGNAVRPSLCCEPRSLCSAMTWTIQTVLSYPGCEITQ